VIASDLPIGLVVRDSPSFYEAVANGDPGAPLGRELELARLLRFIRDREIRNVVWVTGDVHYCAAHEYHPSRAKFPEFDPFWEFVAGPLNAGTWRRRVPDRSRDVTLRTDRCGHGVGGSLEDAERAVSLSSVLEHDAAVRHHRRLDELVMPAEGAVHEPRRPFPQRGRVDDIGEQERQHAGRERSRRPAICRRHSFPLGGCFAGAHAPAANDPSGCPRAHASRLMIPERYEGD
jgi:hypothetical protein